MPLDFFDLPREVRDLIYEQALVCDYPLYISTRDSETGHSKSAASLSRVEPYGLTTTLLRASKAIHREAIKMFYSRNRFDIQMFEGVAGESTEYIGHSNAAYVKHVVAHFPILSIIENDEDGVLEFWYRDLANLKKSCPNISSFTTNEILDTVAILSYWCEKGTRGYDKGLIKVDESLKVFPRLQHKVLVIKDPVLDADKVEISDCENEMARILQELGWSVDFDLHTTGQRGRLKAVTGDTHSKTVHRGAKMILGASQDD